MIAREVLAELPRVSPPSNSASTATGDLRGYALVVSATGDPTVNDRVVEEARRENVWLNVVDDPATLGLLFHRRAPRR